jgi:SAM-dependent methyltransferase
VLDIIRGRVEDDVPPEWCERRGWTRFLKNLDDAELELCEAEGLARRLPRLSDAPESLRELATNVLRATAIPCLSWPEPVLSYADLRRVSARKSQQLAPLLGALRPMAAAAARIVDVGSGSGHLTRLAADQFGLRALGIERNTERVAAAERRLERAAERVEFVVLDACREPLVFAADDLVVGLHACGKLGDRLVEAAARAESDVALVSCCLQKTTEPSRRPLSHGARGIELSREHLGLTNLMAREQGVETDLQTTMRARQARFALRRLFAQHGLLLSPGAEMRGTNRRQANAGFPVLVRRVFEARRLPIPSTEELHRHERSCRDQFALVRRFSLPRNLLARVVELFVVLDRAALLEENGLVVRVVEVFEAAVSPRNLALLASRAPHRLPCLG